MTDLKVGLSNAVQAIRDTVRARPQQTSTLKLTTDTQVDPEEPVLRQQAKGALQYDADTRKDVHDVLGSAMVAAAAGSAKDALFAINAALVNAVDHVVITGNQQAREAVDMIKLDLLAATGKSSGEPWLALAELVALLESVEHDMETHGVLDSGWLQAITRLRAQGAAALRTWEVAEARSRVIKDSARTRHSEKMSLTNV